MSRMIPPIIVGFVLLVAAWAAPAAQWHHPLYLDGAGWWRQRVPVQIINDSAHPLDGFPVACAVRGATAPSPTAGQQDAGPNEAATSSRDLQAGVPLVGQRAESLRVCDAAGREMLFALRASDGTQIERGPIPAEAILTIPAECPANSRATYYVYFDNPRAGEVPDFLDLRTGLFNGDVELGAGDVPDRWVHDSPDDEHRASWSSEHPQSGQRCLKTVVADGAAPSWIATRQQGIAVIAGTVCRLRAWVKAENVRGTCGWYVHVGNREQPMLISPMLSAGDGTFDWRQVSAEFTIPAGADRLSLGTVLRGTGTAWFDNVTLESVQPGPIRTRVLPVETRDIRAIGDDAAWYAPADDKARPYRAVIQALNASDQPQERAVVVMDLGRLQARMRGRLDSHSLIVTVGGRPAAHRVWGGQLLCPATLPARSASMFHVYFAATPADASAAPDDQDFDARSLADDPANRVRNAGFEQGEPLPDDWRATGASARDGVILDLDKPQRAGFGDRCARMRVPASARKAWRGWQQNVPVYPGRSYWLSAWVRCQDVADGEVRLHAHYLQADGKLSQQGGFASVGPGIAGTTDWTRLSGVLSVPADATTLQVHLTMDSSGTVWHDEVVVAEITAGDMLGIESRRPADDDTLAIWQVPAVVKVFQDDPPDADSSGEPVGEIDVARNEQETLQLAIRSPRDVGRVTIEVDAPVGPEGFALQDFRVEVVGFVPIDSRSSYFSTDVPAWHRRVPGRAGRGDGWSGLWPDPLLPTNRCELRAGRTQPVWITVNVPRQAPAGDYRGQIRLTAANQTLATVPLRVYVWDFALPDRTSLAAIYDVRYGPGGRLWGKSLNETYPEIIRFMAARRLCPDMIRPGPVFRRVDGQITADFTAFDQAARVWFDELHFPFSYTPWDLYLFGWGHPPKTILGERPYDGDPPFESADRRQLRPAYKQTYQTMLRLFWEHLKERGWQRRIVLYISDEPFYTQEPIQHQMRALCDMIHEVDPQIPIYSSTWHHVPGWDGYLNIWGIGHYGVAPPDKIAQLRTEGARIWFTTDGQMCTDTPYCAVERLLPHYCFQYGAEAYEFWGVSWHTYDPYRFGWHSFIHQSSSPGQSTWVRYPNGDGFLLYPGEPLGHAGPVSSIRLEQAREGVEDYEYLRLLDARLNAAQQAGRPVAQAEQARAAARGLVQIPNAGGYYSTRILPHPERLYEVRRAVAAAIESLR